MAVLVIHDAEGYILSKSEGFPSLREPVGVPFLWAEVPEGKFLKGIGEIGVDVSVTPHIAILEDVPPTEIEKLNDKVKQQENAIVELAELLAEVLG